MTLFSSATDDGATDGDAPASGRPPRRPRRNAALWVVGIVLVAGVGIAAFAPSPYVVEKPGPVYDTIGDVRVDGDRVPLIDIPHEQTYPTTGTLDMLTVTVAGSREHPESWLDIALARLNPSYSVLDVDDVYPAGQTVEQSNEEGAAEMKSSQQSAIAAALRHLGYDVPGELAVASIQRGGPSDGVLKEGDVIRSVDGTAVTDFDALRSAISANGTAAPVTIGVERDGTASSVAITPETSDDGAIIGVAVGVSYHFPIDVTIRLQDVGGPSAGQMFALGIIDKLTPGSLTGGADVAGTGTIDDDGEVGAIGGIVQKMHGARNAGADWFLAPESNCGEVAGHVPQGLTVVAVRTLDDSLAALGAIAAGDASGLPSCTAG
ncbi:PDZ domain-containing protein [Galbitalea sp. SE-J8]|uniref:YlbL family protein n=1 Tax=Galbitalea sp. SE-J8 TaxID=3054952 RepID=UPI00259CEDC2|nr:PDZ domain-containing protein [Galbitalea sp. SE-J8]MDM4763520.1 PDZ domain-containing protein [Galbitalea sp. SE-J8]